MLLLLFSLTLTLTLTSARNVVHVVYDDFRVDLPIYGQNFIHAPNFVALAARGLTFDRAYCQIAVCSPSRNSFMSGRMPAETEVWNFFNSIREARCSTTLGEHLEGTVLQTWTMMNPEESSGAGGCCTTCTGAASDCVGWDYINKTCRTFSTVTAKIPCPPQPVDPTTGQPFSCMRGDMGVFPTFTTLPQRFREAGYTTLGVGKLYHDGGGSPFNNPDDDQHPPGEGKPPLADPLSWSNEIMQYPQHCTWGNEELGNYKVTCPALNIPEFSNAYAKNKYQLGSAYFTPSEDGCDCAAPGVTCMPLSEPSEAHLKNQACSFNVSADGLGVVPPLIDVPVQIDARAKIAAAAATGKPFFLEIGFKKPHLTFAVPQPYLDLYPRDTFTPSLPKQRTLDASVSPMSWTPFYTQTPNTSLSINTTLELRRYYYAAISWADFHLGQVLAELDAQGLTNDTAVLVHADHGWHLGEYNMWEKRTLWEAATRVPMVLAVPWIPVSHGARTSAPVELVDIYPTLIDLLCVPPPTNDSLPLAGETLMPLLLNPSLPTLPNRSIARSTYARCPKIGGPIYDDACIHIVERTAFPFMGYTIRTVDWRFTVFFAWNGSALSPAIPALPKTIELYDHRNDIPGGAAFEAVDFYEDVNVASANPQVVQTLLVQLKNAFGIP